MLKRIAALCAALLMLSSVPAAGAVTEEDVRRAADDLAAARATAAAALAERTAARQEADEVRDRLQALISRMVDADTRLAEATVDARTRAGELYMAAGADRSLVVIGPQSGVRLVYANAVYASAREAVVNLVAAREDLERVRALMEAEVERSRDVAARVEMASATADAVVGDAERRYASLVAQWEREREAARAAEAEAAAAAAAAAAASTTTTGATTGTTGGQSGATTTTVPVTTTRPTGTTTTTTLPDPVSGGTFPPAVERWRPLVDKYFRNRHVDQALSVMQCESGGDPGISNAYSGAAGLFQHIPKYWPERARAIGMPTATPFDAEANIAAAAWLVQRSLDYELDAWYFWSCKP